jgi:hypothetical protein
MKHKFVESCQGGSASGSCDILKGREAFMKKTRDYIISDNLDAAKEFGRVKGEVTKKQLFEIANFKFHPFCQEIKILFTVEIRKQALVLRFKLARSN